MRIDADRTVGEVAAQSLAPTRVFEDHGIDFCCGGSEPFAEACREKQLDPRAVAAEIDEAARREASSPEARNWSAELLGA